jgi:hypothetical protein
MVCSGWHAGPGHFLTIVIVPPNIFGLQNEVEAILPKCIVEQVGGTTSFNLDGKHSVQVVVAILNKSLTLRHLRFFVQHIFSSKPSQSFFRYENLFPFSVQNVLKFQM